MRDSGFVIFFAACKSIIFLGGGRNRAGGLHVSEPPPEPPQIVYSVNNNMNNVCTWPDSGKFLHKVANISLLRSPRSEHSAPWGGEEGAFTEV